MKYNNKKTNASSPVRIYPAPTLILCWNTLYQDLLYRKVIEMTLKDKTELLLIYRDAAERTEIENCLKNYLLSDKSIKFMQHDYSGIWARDYTPLTVNTRHGEIEFVGYEYSKVKDNLFATVLAKYYGRALKMMPLKMEGGNFICNAEGIAICTDRILKINKIDKEQLTNIFKEFLAIKKLIVVNELPNEATGHIDMFMKFMGNQKLLVSTLVKTMPDYAIAKTNLAIIKNELPAFQIIDIPVAPDNGSYERLGNVFYSYTNSVMLNKVILIPLYGETTDVEALDIYQKNCPDYLIQGIFSKDITQLKGALHCMTGQV